MEIKSMFDLSGKVAVVTGGADGIVAAGGKAIPVTCNVLQDADLVNLIDTTVKTFGTVNILVNNAGLGGGGRENPFKIDVGYVERIYRINVFAPLRLCQLAVPEMSKSGYGSIINITSMSSIDKGANMCVYSSSKAALASILTPRDSGEDAAAHPDSPSGRSLRHRPDSALFRITRLRMDQRSGALCQRRR